MGSAYALPLVTGVLLLAACAPTTTSASVPPETTPPIDRATTLVAACSGCHASTGTAIPALGTYTRDELYALLMAYKQEEAGTTVMHRIARGYTEPDLATISDQLALAGKKTP